MDTHRNGDSVPFARENLEITGHLDFNQFLFESVLSHIGAKECIDRTSALLCNPLIIVDGHFKIVHAAQADRVDDRYWNINLRMGYCSFEFITEVKKIESFLHAPEDEEPFLMTCPGSDTKRLVSKILFQGRLWGYAVLLDSRRPFSESDAEHLKTLSRLYSSFYVENDPFHADSVSAFYIDIIENGLPDASALRQMSRYLGERVTFPMVALCVNVTLYDGKGKSDSYLEHALTSYFPSAEIFVYEYLICLMMPLANFKNQAHAPSWTTFAETHALFLTLSRTMESWNDIQPHFNEAMQLARSSRLIYNVPGTYHAAHMTHLLPLLGMPEHALLSRVSPVIMALKRHDDAGDTPYLHILKALIECRFNKSKAASALFIHRNTLQYHLKKMEEIMAVSLEDSRHDLEWMYSLRILDLMDAQRHLT